MLKLALMALLALTCEPVVAEQVPTQSPAAPAAMSAVIRAGTLIALRVDENLSSRTAKRGDKFSITLMNDIWVGSRVAVPMGAKGVGEVIHAAGKGFGGRAGELIVTARYLEFESRQIRLGHFRLGVAGENNATAALIASAAAPIVGVFVTGTSASIGLGQLGQAKLAEDFQLSPDSQTATAPKSGAEIQGEGK